MGHLLGGSMVELMATSSKRAYATLRTAAPRAPPLQQATADPYLCRRHSNTQRQVWLSLCGVSWCAQGFVWALWVTLAGMGLILKVILPLLPSCWGFSFALGCWYIFLVGSNILLSMVAQQRIVILEFLQEKMSTHPSTPPFCTVKWTCIVFFKFLS